MRFPVTTTILIFLSFTGCKTKSKINTSNYSDTLMQEYPKHKVYTGHNLPLPIEVFEILIKKANHNKQCQSNNVNISSLKCWEKAIYLGIFTANIAYNSEYNHPQEVIKYSEICSKISEELSIPSSYGLKYIDKIEQNITNKDSIIHFTNTAYYETLQLLEKQNQENILPFVVFGGWLETLNIISKCGSEDPELIELALKDIENLIDFLNESKLETTAYHFDEELSDIIENLNNLNQKYTQYKNNNKSQKIKLDHEVSLIKKSVNIN